MDSRDPENRELQIVPSIERQKPITFSKPDKVARQTSDNDRSEIVSNAQVSFNPQSAEVTCTCNFNLFRWRRNRGTTT